MARANDDVQTAVANGKGGQEVRLGWEWKAVDGETVVDVDVDGYPWTGL